MAAKLENLNDLLTHELQDLYDAEHQITEALPLMAEAASNKQLKTAFKEHLEQTKHQIQRLEQVFEQLGEKSKGEKCKGMQGLITEGQKLMKEDAEPAVKDAGLIAAAQKVEHYEIAGYGSARTFAQMLGQEQIAKLLQQTLEEEATTDEKLSRLAESHVNQKAAA